MENLPSIKVKTIELLDSFAHSEGPLVSDILVNVLGDLPLIQVKKIIINVLNRILISIILHTLLSLIHEVVKFFIR